MSFEEPPTLRNGYGLFNSTWPSSSAAAAAARAKAMRDPMEDDEYLTLVWQGEECGQAPRMRVYIGLMTCAQIQDKATESRRTAICP